MDSLIGYEHVVADGPQVELWASQQIILDRIEVDESQRLNLTCLIQANPAVAPGDVRWDLDGVTVGYGTSYVMENVQRSHAGNYSCTAENTLTPSGGQSEKHTGHDGVQVLVRCKYYHNVPKYCNIDHNNTILCPKLEIHNVLNVFTKQKCIRTSIKDVCDM